MKKYNRMIPLNLILGAAVLTAACSPNVDKTLASQRSKSSITGGTTVTAADELGQSVVALVSDLSSGQALCTGSVLSDHLILTAAHCVDDKPSRIRIYFTVSIAQASGDQIRTATGVSQNPYWTNPEDGKRGDLAIVEFGGGLPDGYAPIRLANASFQLSEGDSTIFLGYGVTNGGTHAGSGILRMTNSTVLGAQSPTEVITDGSKSSVCFGDSGGPALVVMNNEYVQWGVASSVSNDSCNDTSVHTAVMQYLPWIRAAMRSGAQEE